ncbi:hypothetical protein [Candidatus Avelusimicrobium fimicolum]|uniref:hypothetical protein n=1 Tax=Candidatus Avelusimicrobium fimicolum TaxID=3416216 RepID=UPI003D107420
MAELKPCECRNNPKIVSKYCESDVGYDVQCKCGKQTRFYFGKQQAIDAWNKRSSSEKPNNCGTKGASNGNVS